MSKLTDKLNAKNVYNDWGFFGNHPFIWHRREDSRACISSSWMVTKKGFRLSEAWYDHGDMSFVNSGRKDKAEKFAEAVAYIQSKFGVGEVARSPFGGYGDAEYIKSRIKELLNEGGD